MCLWHGRCFAFAKRQILLKRKAKRYRSFTMNDVLIKNVLKCVYEVRDELGVGFLEKVYTNSLEIALNQAGLKVEKEKQLKVFFRQQIVGEYYADLIVEDQLVIELKALKSLVPEHSAQLINYLKAVSIKDGLLVNFGPKCPEIKRLYG